MEFEHLMPIAKSHNKVVGYFSSEILCLDCCSLVFAVGLTTCDSKPKCDCTSPHETCRNSLWVHLGERTLEYITVDTTPNDLPSRELTYPPKMAF